MTILKKIKKRLFRLLFGSKQTTPIIWSISTKAKLIALTFDDGPVEPYTSQILDILKKYDAPATFFLLGENVKKFPKIAQRLVREGHEVGNHTYSHPDLSLLTQEEIRHEVAKGEETVSRLTGKKSCFFRPPFGRYNSFLLPAIKNFKYQVILWSIDPVNWHQKNPRLNTAMIFQEAVPGSIILLHDGIEQNPSSDFDRKHVVNKLPQIITGLQQRGFRLVRLSELLAAQEH